MGFFDDLGNKISDAIDTAEAVVSNEVQYVSDQVSNAVDTAEAAVSNEAQYISDQVSNAVDTAEAAVSNEAQYVSDEVSNAVDTAEAAVSNEVQYVSNEVSDAVDTAEAVVSNEVQYVSDQVSNAVDTAEAVVSNEVQYVSNEVSNAVDTAEAAVSNEAQYLKNEYEKIKMGRVASGAMELGGGAGEAGAGLGYIVATDGIGAAAGGGYMVVDGVSKIGHGYSKIREGLNGIDSSNGGSQKEHYLEEKFKEFGPKEGIFKGDNLYNATQLPIAGVALKSGVANFASKVTEEVPVAARFMNTTLEGVAEKIVAHKAAYQAGTFAATIKGGYTDLMDIIVPKPTTENQAPVKNEQEKTQNIGNLLNDWSSNTLSSGQVANQQMGTSKGYSR